MTQIIRRKVLVPTASRIGGTSITRYSAKPSVTYTVMPNQPSAIVVSSIGYPTDCTTYPCTPSTKTIGQVPGTNAYVITPTENTVASGYNAGRPPQGCPTSNNCLCVPPHHYTVRTYRRRTPPRPYMASIDTDRPATGTPPVTDSLKTVTSPVTAGGGKVGNATLFNFNLTVVVDVPNAFSILATVVGATLGSRGTPPVHPTVKKPANKGSKA